MTDMIERVAKAIYEGHNGADCLPWRLFGEMYKERYRSHARAAIAAMREPTEKMVEAFHRDAHFEPEFGVQIRCVTAEDAYRAMIDAALNTGGKDD